MRFFRFRLRTLLLVVLVSAGGMRWSPYFEEQRLIREEHKIDLEFERCETRRDQLLQQYQSEREKCLDALSKYYAAAKSHSGTADIEKENLDRCQKGIKKINAERKQLRLREDDLFSRKDALQEARGIKVDKRHRHCCRF